MKIGVTTSVLAHIAMLGWGMISLANPKPLEVADVEALPVEIIPIEAITKTIEGAKKAPITKKPAPKPTKATPKPTPAKNAGETETDVKAEAPKVAKAPPVEKTEAPTPKTRPEPPKKPTPVPTPKLAPKPEPKKDITALLQEQKPIVEPEPEKPAEEAFNKLPQKVATPKKRPTVTKPEIAKTTDRKNEEKPAKETTKTAEKKKETDAKKKAVLNKADPNAGGKKRSKKPAAAGTKKSNNATKLAQSEIDALRGRLSGCFAAGDLPGHADASTMSAKVTFKLNRDGTVDGRIKARVSGTSGRTKAVFARRVKNAISECAPFDLPPEKYDTWSDVVVNFSLKDML